MKYIRHFLCGLLLMSYICFIGVSYSFAVSDTTGPVVSEAVCQEQGQTLHPGDTAHFSFKMSDISGVSSSISVNFYQATSYKGTSFVWTYDEETETYSSSYSVTANDHDGEYYISTIYVYDTLGNQTAYATNLGFVVEGGISDNDGPIVSDVTCDRQNQLLQPGDTATFSFKASDPSGVRNGISVNFYKGTSYSGASFNWTYDDSTDTYTGTYTVKDSDCDGEYYISTIYVYDTLGNQTAYHTHVGFRIFTEEYTLGDNGLIAQGEWGSFSWSLDKNYTLTIDGEGAMIADSSNAPWKEFRIVTKSIVLSEGITSIGGSAFSSFYSLNEIHFPTTLTSINSYAFYDDTNLLTIDLPSQLVSIGEYAFSGSALQSIIIPSNVTTLEYRAFSYCENLNSVSYSSGLTYIPSRAFESCSSLTSFAVPDSVTYIASDAFAGAGLTNIKLSINLTSIGYQAFASCIDLIEITIPGSVTDIDREAFRDCVSLLTVTLEDGVKSISADAFSGCTAISQVFLPDSINSISDTAIPGNATIYCTEGSYSDVWATKNGYAVLHSLSDPVPSHTPIDGELFGGLWGSTDWSITSDYVLHLSGKGNMIGDCSQAPWRSHKALIKAVLVDEGITSIGKYSFSDFNLLSNVSLPTSITTICSYAFYRNTNLSSLTLPSNLSCIEEYAFCESGLQSIILPDTVTSMGYRSFSYCNKLQSVVYSTGMKSIPDRAFESCSSLESFIVPNSVISIGADAFVGSGLKNITLSEALQYIGYQAFASSDCLEMINIPGKVQSISSEAFRDCIALSKVIVEDGAQEIAADAFEGCSALKSIVLPESITFIAGTAIPGNSIIYCIEGSYVDSWAQENGYAVLYDSNSELPVHIPKDNEVAGGMWGAIDWSISSDSILTLSGSNGMIKDCRNAPWMEYQNHIVRADVMDGITSIGNSTFANMSSLAHVNLPESLTMIGEYAFYNDKNLSTITLPNKLTTIEEYAFSGSGITSIIIPDSVTKMEYRAFSYCEQLTGCTYSSEMKYIPDRAFEGCSSLKTFNVPDSVTNIGADAFAGAGITYISFSSNLASIGYQAFASCSSLTSITIPGTVHSLGGESFRSCTSLETVTFEAGSDNIQYQAFYDCPSLTTVILPESIQSISNSSIPGNATIFCIEGSYADTWASSNGYAVHYIILPETIGSEWTLIIPSSVKSIDDEAFSGINAKKVIVPDGTISIGHYSFSNCDNLLYIVLPESVISISDNALIGSESTTIICHAGSFAEQWAISNNFPIWYR